MYEIFVQLCSEKGVSMRKVSRDTGIAVSTFSEWKKGRKLRNDKLKQLADYFGVSVEYLTTGTKKEDTPSEEDALDEQLIAMLKKLDPAQTQRVLDFVQGMLST